MSNANGICHVVSGELQRLKQHNKETKRLIKDCFSDFTDSDEVQYVWQKDYERLVKHVNKRKL